MDDETKRMKECAIECFSKVTSADDLLSRQKEVVEAIEFWNLNSYKIKRAISKYGHPKQDVSDEELESTDASRPLLSLEYEFNRIKFPATDQDFTYIDRVVERTNCQGLIDWRDQYWLTITRHVVPASVAFSLFCQVDHLHHAEETGEFRPGMSRSISEIAGYASQRRRDLQEKGFMIFVAEVDERRGNESCVNAVIDACLNWKDLQGMFDDRALQAFHRESIHQTLDMISKAQRRMLLLLTDNHQHPIELGVKLNVSNKTAGKHLCALEVHFLAMRPSGERNGWIITPLGRAIANYIQENRSV